jgi:hypothetical protein
MKITIYYLTFICSIFILLTIGCESSDLQKSSYKNKEKIAQRGIDDCSECPNVDDCCCLLRYTGLATVTLKICGTTDGDAATCMADVDGCETIDGLSHSQFTLSTGSQIELFCMLMVRGFCVENLGSGTANLQLTCQVGQTSPQTLNISIPGFGRKCYQTNAECEVEECGH